MYDPAYTDTVSIPPKYCYDDTYSNSITTHYAGYFSRTDPVTNAIVYPVYSYSGGKFVEVPATDMPASCTYGGSGSAQPYVCVNMTVGSPRTVTQFVASGKFLNWIAASKFDVEKKILTGGKYDTVNSVLLGETRGCGGKRFVKVIPAFMSSDCTTSSNGITFAIRGPYANEPGLISQSTQGGPAKIDIYDGTYCSQKCQDALTDWQTGVNQGTTDNDTQACMGGKNTGAIGAYNQALHMCYTYIVKNPGDLGGTGQMNTIRSLCEAVYATQLPNTINDDHMPGAACSSVLTHPLSNSNTTGYLGKCWNGSTWDGPGTEIVAGEKCSETELKDYCGGVNTSNLTDPSPGAQLAGTNAVIPGFVMDAGVNAMPLAGSFDVKVARSSVPTGIINKYSSQLRMGAMSFNYDGSGTECGVAGSGISCAKNCSIATGTQCFIDSDCPAGAGTCVATTRTDGGQMISYIGYNPIGDHSTSGSLIKRIDDLQAVSWTPYAEALYSAIGYFAKTDGEAYTTPPSFGTSRDFRLQTIGGPDGQGDYRLDRNPSQYPCQKNNILLITDGMSTADQQLSSRTLAALYNYDGAYGYDTTNACPAYAGSRNIDELAGLAKKWNIRTFATNAKTSKTCSVSGSPCTSNANCPSSQTCLNAPQKASEYIDTYVVYSGDMHSTLPLKCNPLTLMTATATQGGSSIFTAANPSLLETALEKAFSQIAVNSASGTAASVLASGEGSGANLVQAVFFPSRTFNWSSGSADISWTGVMQNLWYYVDPQLGNSNIREDSITDKTLKLTEDCIVQYFFNATTNQTMANLNADADGNGVSDGIGTCTRAASASFDSINYLWETGKLLFAMSPSDRTIFTNLNADNTTHTRTPFTAGNVPATYLNVASADANNVINYVRGTDSSSLTIDGKNMRNRTVTMTIGGTSVDNTWKLGDIINSTPKIMSWIPLNVYDKSYGDTTYGGGNGFLDSNTYKSRGVVFAGGNDGMLHAFEMGKLTTYNESDRKASLTLKRTCSTTTSRECTANSDCPSGESCSATARALGSEIWGFIPKHSLPYLKYLADPDYCHLYYVDATPYIFDASIRRDATRTCSLTNMKQCAANSDCPTGETCQALDTDVTGDATCVDTDDGASPPINSYANCKRTKNSWRTVLIGSMRTGGACANTDSTCTECVKTPAADPADTTKGLGYSSYFALDVTDPYNPTLLWEFANSDLGYSTTGPAIVRVGDKTKNGRWLAVFASGPTGYVSQGTHQMLGITGHGVNPTGSGTLKLYVVDVRTGDLVSTIPTSETSAFAGTLLNSTFDFDINYKDDAFYFGFTKLDDTHLRSNTVAGASSSFITLDAGASSTDNDPAYKGKFIQTSSDEVKLITAYNGTTKEATVDSPWQTIPAAGSAYFIFNGWTKGGVMRVMTSESTNPDTWKVSKVIDNIGPVSSAVTRLRNNKDGKVRLYFGSGRYFYRINDLIDDSGNQQKIYGIVEPCFTGTGASSATKADCTANPPTIAAVSESDLGNASTSTGSSDADGWFIELDAASSTNGAERVMTDPLAATIGAVFFTTNSPSADICSYGGVTHLWAVRYDTGGQVPDGTLKGKAIIQLSTGSIEEISMEDAFKAKSTETAAQQAAHRGNRRSGSIQGVPPSGQGLSIVVPPKPVDTMLHIRKK